MKPNTIKARAIKNAAGRWIGRASATIKGPTGLLEYQSTFDAMFETPAEAVRDATSRLVVKIDRGLHE